MSLLLFAVLSNAASAAEDDPDDFFSATTPASERGANAGVPSSDVFSEDEGFDIPITQSEEEVKAEAKLQAAVAAKVAAAAAPSTAMPVDLAGAKTLGDNWAPSVVVADRDAVVIDMPVLYALTKKDFDGTAYWLVAEVFADGKKVAEGRANVTSAAVAERGPSVQFFRLFTPVVGGSGVLEVKVSRTPTGGKSQLLFTRSVQYQTAS